LEISGIIYLPHNGKFLHNNTEGRSAEWLKFRNGGGRVEEKEEKSLGKWPRRFYRETRLRKPTHCWAVCYGVQAVGCVIALGFQWLLEVIFFFLR
jgi:hypothetical protein